MVSAQNAALPALEPQAWKQTLRLGEIPVLQLDLSWSELPDACPGFRRINRCCRHFIQVWRQRWEGGLYQDACAAAQEAIQSGRTFLPWQGSVSYTVALQQGELLSLYADVFEYTGGAHGNTIRWADTWQIPSGVPRTLASFFPSRRLWRRQILSALSRQAAARMEGGETYYYDNWPERLKAFFDPDRFYLSEQGLHIYYPLYTLGPYAEGIPVFCIPWSTDQPGLATAAAP